MSMRHAGSIAFLSAVAVLMSVRPIDAAQTGPWYFVCSVDTRIPSNRLIYVSEVLGPYGQRMETNYTSTILERDFDYFLNSKYTPHPGASHCTGYETEAKAKESITKALGFAAGARLVETGWKSDAPAVKATGAPAAPKPTAPAAENKPRPAPKAGADDDPPAAAPAKPAPSQAVETFSYCYAYGTPQGPGTGKPRKQHYYVTPVFARSATDRPDGDWQKFIRAAHTDEAFNASCTPAGPRATTDQKRTEQVGSMRKLANFDVVDVDWKK